MIEPLQIGKYKVGTEYLPLVVAEISGNHGGKIENAHRLIDEISRVGGTAVKLQTYTADMLTIDCDKPDFIIANKRSPWHGRKLYDLYREAHTPLEWHEELFAHARELGLLCFSAPFHPSAVEFLEKLDCPAYKIASFENNYIDLLKVAAQTGKPIIVSTGASTKEMITDAVIAVRRIHRHLMLLKCVSNYPANASDTNLKTLKDMNLTYNCQVGLSDHSLGMGVACAAVTQGASLIEKHVALDDVDSVDSGFSLTTRDFGQFVLEVNRAWRALGKVDYASAGELQFKRSIYVVKDIQAGETFTTDNIRVIRPGYGLQPKLLSEILGKPATCFIEAGTPLKNQF